MARMHNSVLTIRMITQQWINALNLFLLFVDPNELRVGLLIISPLSLCGDIINNYLYLHGGQEFL
jgi:hypothetical protein